jgi:hypothetical protein
MHPIPFQANCLQGSAKDLLVGIIPNNHFDSNRFDPKGASEKARDSQYSLNKIKRPFRLRSGRPLIIDPGGWVGKRNITVVVCFGLKMGVIKHALESLNNCNNLSPSSHTFRGEVSFLA